MRGLATLAAIAITASASAADAKPWFPHRKGECGWVHGKYVIANGSGIRRIVVIGTGHIINIPDSERNIPQSLQAYENHFDDLYVRSGNHFDPTIYGDFKVCAAESFIRGHMQLVRIIRTRRLILGGKPYSGENWWKR